MKKRTFFLSLVSAMMLTLLMFNPNTVQADCINSCGSINDGRCDGNVECVQETDPERANCNRYDSEHGCPIIK